MTDIEQINAEIAGGGAPAGQDGPSRPPRARKVAEEHRMLPASVDAEQGFLCSFLLAPRQIGALAAERRLDAEHFHVPAHGMIFAELEQMWAADRRIDIVTLTQTLHDRNLLENCGGAAFVSQLFTFLPTASNAQQYLDIIQEKRTLREVISECGKLVERAYGEQDNVQGILSDLADAAVRVTAAVERKTVPTMPDHVAEKIERMEARRHVGNNADLLLTGLSKLDLNSPLRLGSMPLICGRQKSGKSILALSIAANLLQDGQRGLWLGLEDANRELIDRLAANLSGVPVARHYRTDEEWATEGGERDWKALQTALTVISELPFTVRDDLHHLSQILAAIEQHKAQYPDLAWVVVDYAQLVQVRSKKGENREGEVARVSRALRLLSLRLNVAILVLSQLNKDGDSRESMALEQDCTAKWQIDQVDESTAVRRINVPFQRNGGSKVCFRLAFRGEIAKYENHTERAEEEGGRVEMAPSKSARGGKPWRSRG